MDYLLLFGSLLSYLLLYKYAALFVLILLSGIGFPIPGNTLMIAVGAFSSQSYFSFPLSLAVAFFAEIIGDVFGYSLMRNYGRAIIAKNYHKRFSFVAKIWKYIDISEKYIKSHQRTTIFLTRFMGSIGTIVNFLSGLAPVSIRTFLLYDALGNFANASIMILLGFFISESWQKVAGTVGIIGTSVYVLLIILLVAIIIKKFNKSKNYG